MSRKKMTFADEHNKPLEDVSYHPDLHYTEKRNKKIFQNFKKNIEPYDWYIHKGDLTRVNKENARTVISDTHIPLYENALALHPTTVDAMFGKTIKNGNFKIYGEEEEPNNAFDKICKIMADGVKRCFVKGGRRTRRKKDKRKKVKTRRRRTSRKTRKKRRKGRKSRRKHRKK